MNLLTAVNPGQYTAPVFDVSYLLYGVLIGAVLAPLAIIPIVRRDKSNSPGYMAVFFVMIILAGSLIGLMGAELTGAISQAPKIDAAEAKYQASVRTWLADDFKIVTTADESSDLVDGKTMATQVNGALTVIHIIPATGGDIALVDSGEHVIAAVR